MPGNCQSPGSSSFIFPSLHTDPGASATHLGKLSAAGQAGARGSQEVGLGVPGDLKGPAGPRREAVQAGGNGPGAAERQMDPRPGWVPLPLTPLSGLHWGGRKPGPPSKAVCGWPAVSSGG